MAAQIKTKQSIHVFLIFSLSYLLILYSLCRLGFYFVNRNLFDHLSFSELALIFWGGLRFDLVAILYLNAIFILLLAIPFPFRYRRAYLKVCKIIFIVSNSLGFLANFADFVYYRYTLKHTTASVFSQFANEQNKLNLLVDFLVDYWYLVIAFGLFIYLFARLYDIFEIARPAHYTWRTYIIHSLLLLLIAGGTIIGIRGGWRHSTRPITMSNAGDYVKQPADMALVLNTPFTLIKTLKRSTLKPIHYYDQQTLNRVYQPIHLPEGRGPFKKLNVVYLIIESLGKEHIGALNKDLKNGTYKGYTPFVDSLVANSFTSTRTYANGRKSIDALPSIISGIPSIREPFVLSSYSGNRTTSMAKLLGEEGYETAFFHGAPNGSMGFSAYTNLAGFQHYFGKTEYANDADFDGIWGIWDEPFLQYMAKTLNTFKQPFFSAFFSVSSHHPFKVPEKYAGKFPKGPLPVQEPLGYTDMSLRRFFDKAKYMPWYKNTLFVICADHATVSYLPEYQTTPGYFSIPILFFYPGGELKGKTDKLIQQIDILPTVLNYLNYDKPYFAFGFDAFDTNQNNFVVNNNDGSYSFYQGDYLLINDGQKSKALYNLKNDRLTKQNLLGKLAPVQAAMETYLKAFIQQYNNRMINNQLTAN